MRLMYSCGVSFMLSPLFPLSWSIRHFSSVTMAGESSRQDIGQRPLDMIHLFANHPNCLLLHRNRGSRNRLHSMTDLVIAIPDEVDPRRGFRPVLVNFLHQLGGKPRKC